VTSSSPAHDANSKNPFIAKSPALRLPSGDSAAPNPDSKDWQKDADDLARIASVKTVKALQDLASRLGYVSSANRDPMLSQLPHSSLNADDDITYCKGALLLQKSQSDVYSIVERQSSDQQFICKYCSLEISDFQWNAPNHGTEHWSLLASCHVLACPSLKDRRAAYRCFTCLSIEASAAAIRAHVDACTPRMTWDKKGKKKLREARKNRSSPVKESAQTAHAPPLSFTTPVRDSSASLDTRHALRASNTTTLVANPQTDARDGFIVSDQIMPPKPRRPAPPAPSSDQTAPLVPALSSERPLYDSSSPLTQSASRPSDTAKLPAYPRPNVPDGVHVPSQTTPPIPRRPIDTALSPDSANQTAPPVPQLPKSIPLRAAATTERREQNDEDSGARDFSSLPGSFPSPESLAAHTPRTYKHPNIGQPSTPTPMTTPTSPASSANRASVSGHPEDITNRGRLKSSRRHQNSASNPAAVPPLPASTPVADVASDAAEAAKIDMLHQLGIPRAQAESCLVTTVGNVPEAAELYFSSGTTGRPAEDQPPPSPLRERRRSRSRSHRWLDRIT
jgi:hypothetical protein